MDHVQGARSFQTSGAAYDAFMGRYSRPLAVAFADRAGVAAGQSVLDVGCGPGALTSVLVERLGVRAVRACDPSEPFVAECAARHPGVDVRRGRAETLPFEDHSFDAALSQLVLHFVSEPAVAAAELARVLRPGGTAAACVWDATGGMQMLRHFWDAALTVGLDVPDEAMGLRFGGSGEITGLLAEAGFHDLAETTVTVTTTYADLDDLWSGVLAGIGPAGACCVSLPPDTRDAVRAAMDASLGSPPGPFVLDAVARCIVGRAPRGGSDCDGRPAGGATPTSGPRRWSPGWRARRPAIGTSRRATTATGQRSPWPTVVAVVSAHHSESPKPSTVAPARTARPAARRPRRRGPSPRPPQRRPAPGRRCGTAARTP